ncbi:NADH:ubiquinone reductase (H(+)-translocating) [Handroanthus impetiginosus]|uniref:NADH:ubiquinone reductase (H(+)-translocating) n=1 Tax=Handroanthus impetiginosus TaxID=429701 RepID=A0A2G9FVY6_9LAMI|nr:NADH:ubiquinone reductase (H(+)-translocating) [Handroanthus impetiginosus]
MIYSPTIISIIEVLLVTVPVLLTVAFVTVAERKTMASMQRRLGPNIVGYYGLLQAFADALKLLIKEYISPTQANLILFFLGPVITLIFSLLGYAVVPYGSVAETNRAPFDLAEAESELVSGFMTEHAAVIFVFFFLAEYASIVLICILNTMLFIGGYLLDSTFILYSFSYLFYALSNVFMIDPILTVIGMEKEIFGFISSPLIEGMIYGLTMGVKSCVMIFIFI